MPQKRNSDPPPVMTWTKATPVLAIAILFDALRLLFEGFWFFGPALAALYCANKVGGVWLVGGLITKACVIGAAALGLAAVEVTAVFGTLMAMVVGFAGWLTVGITILISNGRMLRANIFGFVASLLVSEIPIIGSIPAITIAVWRMYRRQIKTDRAAMKKWEAGQANIRLQEQNQQAMALLQIQAGEQQAADEESYAEEQAAQQAEEDELGAEAQFEEQDATDDDTYHTVRKAA